MIGRTTTKILTSAVLSLSLIMTSCGTKTVKAGTYSATEKGFGGDVTVNLSLDETGKITKVDINAEKETPSVGQAAAPKLAESIIKNQSFAIDVVSGATFTSNAVLAATKAAIAASGANVENYNKKIAKNGTDEEVTVDVVIAGAGGGGTGAALAAAEQGLDVLILEKLASYGGNTRLSSGFFAIGTKWQKESKLYKDNNWTVDVSTAVQKAIEANNYLSNGPLTRAIIEKSASTVEWLEKYGMDIYLQEKTTQFAHEGDPYKGFSYHKYRNSTEGFDNIYANLEKMGAKLRTNTRFTELIYENGKVTGCIAEKEDGGKLTVHAKAVVVATGGFGGDVERVKNEAQTPYLNSIGMPSNGEGLDAMVKIGAKNWDASPLLHGCQLAESQVAQESSEEQLAGYSDSALTWLLQSPLLWVDASGSRFANEDAVYDTVWWANVGHAAGGRYFIVVDQATLDSYTNGDTLRLSYSGPGPSKNGGDFTALAEQAVKGKTAWKANSLSELAKAVGFNENDFTNNVERYNSMIANKKDSDYGKKSENLRFAVSKGPFYAFDCRAVFLGTVGGVKVDENLAVLDINTYKPIPGLYTAGANAGGYYSPRSYPPYEGMASGFAWTSGRIAGESAAAYAKQN